MPGRVSCRLCTLKALSHLSESTHRGDMTLCFASPSNKVYRGMLARTAAFSIAIRVSQQHSAGAAQGFKFRDGVPGHRPGTAPSAPRVTLCDRVSGAASSAGTTAAPTQDARRGACPRPAHLRAARPGGAMRRQVSEGGWAAGACAPVGHRATPHTADRGVKMRHYCPTTSSASSRRGVYCKYLVRPALEDWVQFNPSPRSITAHPATRRRPRVRAT